VVESKCQTPSVPYGDTFFVCQKLCLTWVTRDSCRLMYHGGVKFVKNPLMKGIIKTNAAKGIQESAPVLLGMIKSAVEEANPNVKTALQSMPSVGVTPVTKIESQNMDKKVWVLVILLTLSLCLNGYMGLQSKDEPILPDRQLELPHLSNLTR
jgi:hypothetical protein